MFKAVVEKAGCFAVEVGWLVVVLGSLVDMSVDRFDFAV